jgi:hypothetical protein
MIRMKCAKFTELRKLVTAHYCVEIISRLPTLAFFHYACKSNSSRTKKLVTFQWDVGSPTKSTNSVVSFDTQLGLKPCQLAQVRRGPGPC